MASLDPLDRELFQRAFDAACSAVKADELDTRPEYTPYAAQYTSTRICSLGP